MYCAPSRLQVIAHRGFSGLYPENTLIAIDAAIRLGVDMVEVDVRLSRDGVPVLLHDASLESTTNGKGKVYEQDANALGKLDAGGWKSPEFQGERIPTLAEALRLARHRVALNLDLKTADAIVPTIALVRQLDMLDQVVLSGLRPCHVRWVRRLEPRIHVLLNGHGVFESLMRVMSARCAFALTLWQARRSAALGLNVSHRYVARPLIDRAHAHNLRVWTWTIDDPVRAAALAQLGVAAITSNWPDRILPLARHKEFSSTCEAAFQR
ncbi:glycerophosphodiester phosphodiesterase [Caldilinea sp.]|jgi:glycerophosphoryl diester phosphodiesterase|uniref:glycerophosphodiester phosphodiesterase n=1 Tax=Caldilinea sp. TaxID=2293560 RepID=UPI0021DD9342|nr:glycerophosphodiester phosphodiesterase family protein [Caldilinea sp.]GIV67811.1 MAG: putative glycerophosphoryl diester phosphodiesterase YhdW [Caldilinea sp.]